MTHDVFSTTFHTPWSWGHPLKKPVDGTDKCAAEIAKLKKCILKHREMIPRNACDDVFDSYRKCVITNDKSEVGTATHNQ